MVVYTGFDNDNKHNNIQITFNIQHNLNHIIKLNQYRAGICCLYLYNSINESITNTLLLKMC